MPCEGELGGRDAWLRKARGVLQVWAQPCQALGWPGAGERPGEPLEAGAAGGPGPSCVFMSLCAHSGTAKRGGGGLSPVPEIGHHCPRLLREEQSYFELEFEDTADPSLPSSVRCARVLLCGPSAGFAETVPESAA